MKFQVPATISKIVTMADKSLRLQVDTQELTKADKAKVFELHEEIGWFMFSRAEFKEEDVINLPEIKPEFKGELSPSQKLRNRLWVYFTNTHSDIDNFDSWYKKEMDRIGKLYLSKVNN